MSRPVGRLDEREVLRRFPINDRVPGWFFRVDEISAGAYEAAGTDLWGRQVSCHRDDPDVALAKCVADATAIVQTQVAPS